MNRPDRVVRYGPVVGTANAIAPPLRLREVEGGLVGTVTFSAAHESRPGIVHDGVAAMILDVALADANISAGVPGLTAQLTVRFHRPIPVGQVMAVTSRHDRVDGRKAYSSGEILLGDEVCVSAEGLFVTAKREVTDAK
jgi:acyl-coenzyme A thioesterase PaaI-like protein